MATIEMEQDQDSRNHFWTFALLDKSARFRSHLFHAN